MIHDLKSMFSCLQDIHDMDEDTNLVGSVQSVLRDLDILESTQEELDKVKSLIKDWFKLNDRTVEV